MTTAAWSVTQVPAALDSRRHHDVVLLEEPWQGNLSKGIAADFKTAMSWVKMKDLNRGK